jgi:hypothetical protein
MSDTKTHLAITRDSIDLHLDKGQIQVLMRNGNWWTIRRNGATRRWKRDADRIYVPFKAGLYVYGAITESDFGTDGILNSNFRLTPEE